MKTIKEPIKVTENAIIKAAYVNENGDILGEEEIRIENIDKENQKNMKYQENNNKKHHNRRNNNRHTNRFKWK